MSGRDQAAEAERTRGSGWAAYEGMHAVAIAGLGGALMLLPTAPNLLAASGFGGMLSLHWALVRVGRRAPLALACGLSFGVSAHAVALHSLVSLLANFAHVGRANAWALALLAWLAQAAPYGLTGLLHALARRRGVPSPWAFPLALVLAHGCTPQLFPWRMAATQVGFRWFVQVADLGGEALVDLLMGLLVALSAAAAHAGTRKRVGAAICALALLGSALAYGVLRIRAVEALRARAPRYAIGVVQSNVDIAHKHDEQRARAILADLRRLTRQLEQTGVDLTVWGETAYPYPLLREASRAPSDVRRVLGAGVAGPVLLGLETYAGSVDDSRFNTAWLVRADGSLGERVDKTQLVPFGEFVPFWSWSAALQRRYRTRGFSAGKPGVIHSGQASLGVLICYEDLFASAARNGGPGRPGAGQPYQRRLVRAKPRARPARPGGAAARYRVPT